MTISASITLGLESPELTPEQTERFYLYAAGQCFPDGHRIVRGTGRWLSAERGVIDEPCLTVHVIGVSEAKIKHFAQLCKAGGFQDSVLIEISRPEVTWL